MFWPIALVRKLADGTKPYQLLLVLLLGSACLPDPQRMQMAQLLDNLGDAHSALMEQPPRVDSACDTVGDVQSRLWGEPGLADVKPAWPAMRQAADALLAVCGQDRLLAQPFEPTPATLEARERWQAGAASELEIACRSLGEAAVALGRATSGGCGAS
jgi:hypothetical protein